MEFPFTEERLAIRDAVAKICSRYDDAWWRERDETKDFPEDFVKEMAQGGWFGIAMPQEYGGAGLGVTEAAIVMQTIAAHAGFTGASSVHINMFGPHPVVVHGTEEQKARMLPPLIRGEDRACFAITEPDAGLDTSRATTSATLQGSRYIVNGRKMWTTTAKTANRVLLLTRTSPRDPKKPLDGLTLFYTAMDRNFIETTEIPKMGRHAVDCNMLFIDNLPVPAEDRIGEEGKGFRMLIDGINPERILVAAEAVGMGRLAIDRTCDYARERIVFDRPIGANQGIQHPLADSWARLEAADALVWKAAQLYDSGQPAGSHANAAKHVAAEVCFQACERAVMAHGGMGYARESHVERWLRESFVPRLAPVSREMILNHIAQHTLRLPRSY